MRNLVRASVLIMVLAVPVFAGDIPYDVASKPPANATAQPNGVTGDIPYDVTSVWLNLLVALIA